MAMEQEQTRYELSLKAETPEAIPLSFFALTFNDLKELLSHLEQSHTGESKAQWGIETDGINLVAQVNGVSGSELEAIVSEAYDGFRIAEMGGGEDWPVTYDDTSKEIIKRVINRVKKTFPATIETGGKQPIRIQASMAAMTRAKRERYMAWSSIEGTLDVISVHKRPFFVIYEHGSKARVRCTFPDDWTANVVGLLRQRVIVEGYVYYRQSGEAYLLTSPTSIDVVPAPSKDLLALRGTIPGITQGLSSYDYMRKVRQEDDVD